MFDFVARNKRLLQIVLALVIVPPFAFWGVESFQRSGGAMGSAAKVGDQTITEQEFAESLRAQQDRLRTMLGRNFDAVRFDTPEFRAEVLEGMITQRLLAQYAVKNDLLVDDARLREFIATHPAFQDGGKFSMARYEETVRSEGQVPASFESILRRDLMMQQLTLPLSDFGIASLQQAKQVVMPRQQKREIAERLIKADAFAGAVKITPEAVQAYYDGNKAQFEVPEQVRVEYATLNAVALEADEKIDSTELKSVYESSITRFGEAEQRQASHILVPFKSGATADDKAKARETAQSLLDKARKLPGSFAELAKANSGDPGSASKGGDVGFFSRGMMVKPFEDAAFSLKPGEISGLVESDFGIHIIRLANIKAAKVKPFEQARDELERELKKQRAGRKYAEAAEVFANLVYEQPDSLKPVAERFKIQILQSGWTTRRKSEVELLNGPKVLSAMFSDDVLKNKRNSEALEAATGTIVSVRLLEHRPTTVRPFDEVKADIGRLLTRRESMALARKQGLAQLETLKKGEGGAANFGATRSISREDPKGMAGESLNAVFRTDVSKLPAYAGVELPDAYAIYRIGKVVQATPDDAKLKAAQAELGRAEGAMEFRAFVSALRARAGVEINKAALEKKQ
ncbi:MAG: peptidylprolyl isomerase [Betaproteobacteria bacterium]|nr:peptidylprolyl isomerase [Betaproteobacteria bacterium]